MGSNSSYFFVTFYENESRLQRRGQCFWHNICILYKPDAMNKLNTSFLKPVNIWKSFLKRNISIVFKQKDYLHKVFKFNLRYLYSAINWQLKWNCLDWRIHCECEHFFEIRLFHNSHKFCTRKRNYLIFITVAPK